MDNTQHNTQKVLHAHNLPPLIENSNIGERQGYLSLLQYEPVTGMPDFIIDHNKPQTPPPPLPAGRQSSANMYDEIPEIPEYLELEQAGIQPPKLITITVAGDRWRVTCCGMGHHRCTDLYHHAFHCHLFNKSSPNKEWRRFQPEQHHFNKM